MKTLKEYIENRLLAEEDLLRVKDKHRKYAYLLQLKKDQRTSLVNKIRVHEKYFSSVKDIVNDLKHNGKNANAFKAHVRGMNMSAISRFFKLTFQKKAVLAGFENSTHKDYQAARNDDRSYAAQMFNTKKDITELIDKVEECTNDHNEIKSRIETLNNAIDEKCNNIENVLQMGKGETVDKEELKYYNDFISADKIITKMNTKVDLIKVAKRSSKKRMQL